MRGLCFTWLLVAVLAISDARAQIREVDLELVLLADATGSIDAAEIAFQRNGYAAAITHSEVLNVIAGGLTGKIAVTYVEWGDESAQDVVVPWTIIDGATSAKAFTEALLAAPRRAYGFNAIGSALAKAQALIEGNDIHGLRKVIDISGDSANNWDGIPIEMARASAIAKGITINGLAILCRRQGCGGQPVTYNVATAFRQKIIGGPGSFVVTADGRNSFAEAVRQKLVQEIAALPPPVRGATSAITLTRSRRSGRASVAR